MAVTAEWARARLGDNPILKDELETAGELMSSHERRVMLPWSLSQRLREFLSMSGYGLLGVTATRNFFNIYYSDHQSSLVGVVEFAYQGDVCAAILREMVVLSIIFKNNISHTIH